MQKVKVNDFSSLIDKFVDIIPSIGFKGVKDSLKQFIESDIRMKKLLSV